MRAQSMNLPFPSAWGHSIVKKIADHARRGYAAGRLSADVFYRFDILTIRQPIDALLPCQIVFFGERTLLPGARTIPIAGAVTTADRPFSCDVGSEHDLADHFRDHYHADIFA